MLDFSLFIKSVDDDINEIIKRDFTGEKTGWLEVGPKKYFLPSRYKEIAADIYNMEIRKDDIWIVTFPRTGTTVTQEMIWLIANNCDFETAAKIPLIERYPFLEFNLFMHEKTKEIFLKENENNSTNQEIIKKLGEPIINDLKEMKSRRFVKTHLPFSLLPKNLLNAKVIYLARNPADVAVSYYHLSRLMRTTGFEGNFKQFWNHFKNGHVAWAPFWDHLKEGWDLRHNQNVLFLFYEDIVKDLSKTITVVADFLNKKLTDSNLEALNKHLEINNFRKNPSVNFDIMKTLRIQAPGEQTFIRKGKTHGNSDELTIEIREEIEEWINKYYRSTDMRFPVSEKKKIC